MQMFVFPFERAIVASAGIGSRNIADIKVALYFDVRSAGSQLFLAQNGTFYSGMRPSFVHRELMVDAS